MASLGKPNIRPTVAQIDLGALQRNYLRLERRLSGTPMLAAVKGDAYGHGSVRVALALQDVGCTWFGVALVEEGRALREAGVTGRILVLSGSGRGGTEVVLDRSLTPALFDLAVARRFDAAARRRGEVLPVHLKLDTGMGRLGVSVTDWPAFVEAVAGLDSLTVEGVLSHLASAESDPEFTAIQLQRFDTALRQAEAAGLSPTVRHVANSAALLGIRRSHLDLVRPGIALYGASPGGGLEDGVGLEPVMSVRTRVLYVRDLAAGESVSYGRTWTAARPSRIAWLPVGYADGYLRSLSNQAEVLVHGRRAPVRGRVCMDLTAIDVTDLPDVAPGDEVVLLGRQGSEVLTATELAMRAGTIAYDVLTSFSARVPRRHLVSSVG